MKTWFEMSKNVVHAWHVRLHGLNVQHVSTLPSINIFFKNSFNFFFASVKKSCTVEEKGDSPFLVGGGGVYCYRY